MSKSIFISYSHADEQYKDELLTHLAALKREGVVDVWHDRKLVAGESLDGAIEAKLEEASLVILLISAAFISSDYCAEREMLRAFERNRRGETIVVSVIVRACQWANVPLNTGDKLGDFVALPRDAKPITTFPDRDVAWDQVVSQIRRLLNENGLRDRSKSLDSILPTPHHNGSMVLADDSERKSRINSTVTKELSDHLVDVINRLSSLLESQGSNRAQYGFSEIDYCTGGLHPGELVLLAARPMMDKSALITSIAFNVAQRAADAWSDKEKPKPAVAYFSLGMPADEISYRVLAQRTGLSLWQIRRAKFADDEWDRFVLAMRDLADLPLTLTVGTQSLTQMETVIRSLHSNNDLKLVVVDDLQRIEGWNMDAHSRLAQTVKDLKALAVELGVPFVISSGLSDGVDERDDKRPVISDLSIYGPVQEFADTIIFLYRDAPYLMAREPQELGSRAHAHWLERMEQVYNKAEIFVERSLGESTRSITLDFDQSKYLFKDFVFKPAL